ncbi:MAG TPA: helix-turn-helix domain-containing protein [Nakamurella sp.]
MGGDLIREARRRAGLTQAELAARAGTTQSGIARWESGRTSPSLDDVRRLIRLCGLDLEVAIVPYDGSDMAQAERLLTLTPQERLERHQRLVRQLSRFRKAGRGA